MQDEISRSINDHVRTDIRSEQDDLDDDEDGDDDDDDGVDDDDDVDVDVGNVEHEE
jgi:hypothetical protein